MERFIVDTLEETFPAGHGSDFDGRADAQQRPGQCCGKSKQ